MTTTQHPPIDRELAETVWPTVLDQRAAQAQLTDQEIVDQMAAGAAVWDMYDLSLDGAVEVTETTIPSADGAENLPVLILRPSGVAGPLPCIYYVANAGKMQQSSRVAVTDAEARLVAELRVAFVSVAPRVGRDNPHPAQVEDAYAGLQWVAGNAEALGVDPARLAIMGKSGGGGIAAATALYARDHGGPALSHQILVYPMIDDRAAYPSSGFDTAPWPAANNRIGWRALLGDAAGGPDVSAYAAPSRATDLGGLPPTYVEVGSAEVFRDEDLDYAVRLAHAGVPVEIHSWMGGFHGFEIFAPDTEIARACLAARTSYLRRALVG